MKNRNKATLIGLVAIFLWSAIVGLIRSVSDHLGPTGGAAMMYSVASVFLLLSVGWVGLREFPRRYLAWGSLLFVAYELCLSLSIGYADTSRQAIEVGMVNYLWPTFTIVAAIPFNRQRANFLIVPGFVLSIIGIGWVLGGEQGFDLPGMLDNVQDNPLSYGLAFAGALIWAAYCTVTARIACGKNGVTLFFVLVSVALWAKYLARRRRGHGVRLRGRRLPGAGRRGHGLWLRGLERGHPARQRDHPGRRLVLHPGLLRGPLHAAAAHAAVPGLLAGRGHGVRRRDPVLAGHARAAREAGPNPLNR
ncbi:multidrug resistance efflux transporter [Alicycliphilus sp. B1]|nr:multidrug resistance efflux transporter [Alicycliphilus sp. B1]